MLLNASVGSLGEENSRNSLGNCYMFALLRINMEGFLTAIHEQIYLYSQPIQNLDSDCNTLWSEITRNSVCIFR